MEKKKLQELFPDYELMTFEECFKKLDWQWDKAKSGGAENIKCCDEKVTIGGWTGPEHAGCSKCRKGMQDVTGIMPHPAMAKGAGVVQHIDYDEVEIPKDGKVWITVNCWGL